MGYLAFLLTWGLPLLFMLEHLLDLLEQLRLIFTDLVMVFSPRFSLLPGAVLGLVGEQEQVFLLQQLERAVAT
jgi:hypothetical protein